MAIIEVTFTHFAARRRTVPLVDNDHHREAGVRQFDFPDIWFGTLYTHGAPLGYIASFVSPNMRGASWRDVRLGADGFNEYFTPAEAFWQGGDTVQGWTTVALRQPTGNDQASLCDFLRRKYRDHTLVFKGDGV